MPKHSVVIALVLPEGRWEIVTAISFFTHGQLRKLLAGLGVSEPLRDHLSAGDILRLSTAAL